MIVVNKDRLLKYLEKRLAEGLEDDAVVAEPIKEPTKVKVRQKRPKKVVKSAELVQPQEIKVIERTIEKVIEKEVIKEVPVYVDRVVEVEKIIVKEPDPPPPPPTWTKLVLVP